jgi:hypothetical protein
MLFMPTLGYGVVLGSLNAFLLWSTTKTFHQPEDQWVLLLTAHSIGAIVGSVIDPRVIESVGKMRILNLYLWARLCKLVWLIATSGNHKIFIHIGYTSYGKYTRSDWVCVLFYNDTDYLNA